MSIAKNKLQDLAFASPLVAFYLYQLIWKDIPNATSQLRFVAENGLSFLSFVQLLTVIVNVAFGGMLVSLLMFRMPPVRTIRGIGPRVLAFPGTFAALGFRKLDPSQLTLTIQIIAVLLVFIGTTLTLYALIYLGRSFSIVPEARELVTGGPYKFVRHPVYVFEEIAIFGTALQYHAPASTLLLMIHVALQFTRLTFEEQVLRENFPEYESYAAKTARLLPGVY